MKRRDFLKMGAGATASFVGRRDSIFSPSYENRTTHIYKRAGNCDIKADVYGQTTTAKALPTIIWIHGGALITGSRDRVPDWLHPSGTFLVVSIDYRLA